MVRAGTRYPSHVPGTWYQVRVPVPYPGRFGVRVVGTSTRYRVLVPGYRNGYGVRICRLPALFSLKPPLCRGSAPGDVRDRLGWSCSPRILAASLVSSCPPSCRLDAGQPTADFDRYGHTARRQHRSRVATLCGKPFTSAPCPLRGPRWQYGSSSALSVSREGPEAISICPGSARDSSSRELVEGGG